MDNYYGYGMSSGAPRDNNGKDGKPDPARVLNELRNLRHEFSHKAQDYQRMAKAVEDAMTLLQAAENKKQEDAQKLLNVSLEQRGAFIGGMLLASKQKNDFIVLIDGSGSMNGGYLTAALDAATILQTGAKHAKSAAAIALFGDQQPHWVKGALTDNATRAPLEKGLNSGTDLYPSLEELRKLAAVNTVDGKKTHIVIVSDGDIFDQQKSKEVLELLLKNNRKVTIDFVIMARPGSSMERLAAEVAAAFPAQVKQRRVDMLGIQYGYSSGYAPSYGTPNGAPAPVAVPASPSVQDAVVEIVSERLRPASRKKAAPQPA